MTFTERFDELEALGAHIWEALPPERRDEHQIDRTRLEQGSQCVCLCGTACGTWVDHLLEVRDHAERWHRLRAHRGHPVRILLGAGQVDPDELCRCGHAYRRHLTGLDGCASCERLEVPDDRCTAWQRQLEGILDTLP